MFFSTFFSSLPDFSAGRKHNAQRQHTVVNVGMGIDTFSCSRLHCSAVAWLTASDKGRPPSKGTVKTSGSFAGRSRRHESARIKLPLTSEAPFPHADLTQSSAGCFDEQLKCGSAAPEGRAADAQKKRRRTHTQTSDSTMDIFRRSVM